jgi:hypothetical protein
MSNQQLCDALETLIDSKSLPDVLLALETVCHEKADHLRSNWQDAESARAWERAGRQVRKAWANLPLLA